MIKGEGNKLSSIIRIILENQAFEKTSRFTRNIINMNAYILVRGEINCKTLKRIGLSLQKATNKVVSNNNIGTLNAKFI